jgi:hypothetical protein
MKLILSRKGFDSGQTSGGMASPILPCGCLCSIPIPYKQGVSYSDIWFGNQTFQQIIRELNPNWSATYAHLDPDLRAETLKFRPEKEHWRPAFGQSAAAAGVLSNQGVGEGDLFLFFGWFRKTKKHKKTGRLRFDGADVGRHIIYGWLEVGEVVNATVPLPGHLLFLRDHPHVRFAKIERGRNCIYVSSKSGRRAGLFATENKGIVLTKEAERRRTRWQLPDAFRSLSQKRDLTYHHKEWRWTTAGGSIELQSVSKGQEFVFDGKLHPEAQKYFVERIKAASTTSRECLHNF